MSSLAIRRHCQAPCEKPTTKVHEDGILIEMNSEIKCINLTDQINNIKKGITNYDDAFHEYNKYNEVTVIAVFLASVSILAFTSIGLLFFAITGDITPLFVSLFECSLCLGTSGFLIAINLCKRLFCQDLKDYKKIDEIKELEKQLSHFQCIIKKNQ